MRYWAAARAAAGVDEDVLEVSGPVSLAEVLREVRGRHVGGRFAPVLESCSLMVGDRPVTAHDPEGVLVSPGENVEVLPAFAGG
ncbi:MAG: thiamine S protein [Nocardioidaceae bacterium]|nr:thiamine S protein [Nocardioidaceae bacterium]